MAGGVVKDYCGALGDLLIKKRSGAWSEGLRMDDSSGQLRQDYDLLLLFTATTTVFRSGTDLGL
jgi:hypothetical protein